MAMSQLRGAGSRPAAARRQACSRALVRPVCSATVVAPKSVSGRMAELKKAGK